MNFRSKETNGSKAAFVSESELVSTLEINFRELGEYKRHPAFPAPKSQKGRTYRRTDVDMFAAKLARARDKGWDARSEGADKLHLYDE